ncbi:prophage tail fiber N-terminal domain-containing protein, partial [Escherichia coli]
MAVKISGVLKDGAGKPVQNCTIQLKAKRNSTTVVVNTVASENPDEAGRYSMDVEYGQYSVILLVEGFPPSHAGTITVYEGSRPGTLNDFLGAMTEDDVMPEALRRFEAMVEEAARNAEAASQSAAAAKKSETAAASSKNAAKTSETSAASSASSAASSAAAAENSAKAAKTSETNAKSSETAAEQSASAAAGSKTAAASSASAASTSARQASASATAAGKSAENAASSASTATTKAGEATEQATAAAMSASAAKTSETNAKASETRAESSKTKAASSASSAASSASSASVSKDEATRQASAAKGSATTASTKATEAAGSATAAAQSKSTAESAATRAETAAKRAENIASAVGLKDASTTTKGLVRLSNRTDSDSQTEAATPRAVKAVKDVMDETRRVIKTLAGKVLELEDSGTVTLQSDIYDRPEGVAAIPGSLGYGGYYRHGDKVIFRGENTPADFASWASSTPPGRYAVEEAVSGNAPPVIDKENRLTGVVEIIIPDTANALSQARADKIIIFISRNGEIFTNKLKRTSAGFSLTGWGSLRAGALRSADFWGNPGIDGVTL